MTDIGKADRGVSRRQFLRTSLGLIAAAGLADGLAACSPAQPAPASPNTNPAPGATSAPAAAPATKGAARELIVGINADPNTLDTRTIVKTQAMAMSNHICQALLMRDASGQLQPWLAESWTKTSPTETVFKLRSGVKFTNGEPLDAAAVKFTYDNFLVSGMFPSISKQKQDWLRALDRVEVVDQNTVKLVAKYASNALMSYIPFYSILPPKAAAEMGDKFAISPIGTGPYKMGEYVPNSHLTLVANPESWSGAPKTAQLTFRFIAEDATRMAALQAGEVAMVNNVTPDFANQFAKNSAIQVKEISAARSMYLYFLCNKPPFNKPEARKAVSYAIDRQALVRDVMGGHAKLGGSPWSPSVRYQDASLQPDPYDLAKAKQLLASSGYDGTAVKFGYTTSMWLNDKTVAEFLLSGFKDLGINMNAETLDYPAFYSNVQKWQYNFSLQSYGILPLYPDFFAGTILIKSDSSLIMHDDQKIFDLIAQADKAPDEQGIQKAYYDLQKEILDYAPVTNLYYFPYIVAQSPKLQGYEPRPDEHFFFWDASLSS
jgi:peptide/nickel transport system substrate-binding protein